MPRKEKGSNRRRRPAAAAFTLLEVLLVLVILVVLGSMAAVGVMGRQGKAEQDAALAQVQIFDRAIEMYRFDTKKYPESLDELIEKPSDSTTGDRWNGPYLNKKKVPLDPWDQEFRVETKDDSYRVWSVGPDGSDGTDDDISSAE